MQKEDKERVVSDLTEKLRNSDTMIIADYRGPAPVHLDRARAALLLIAQLGWPWKAASALRILPDAVLNPVYDAVARHRYRVFGRREQCFLPRPEDRGRFIDEEAGLKPGPTSSN